MKILMIAPEPFFEPRGTPFSEYFRIKALTELGHHIDRSAYHSGWAAADTSCPAHRLALCVLRHTWQNAQHRGFENSTCIRWRLL